MIEIASRKIGPGQPVFIVAEMSANHLGSLDDAKRLVYAAKEAGADAVKSQCYDPASMTIDSDAEPFRIRSGPWAGKTLWDLYRTAMTPWAWLPEIKALAESLGMIWFSSVFDARGLEFLESIGCPAYKIASFELTDLPLIRQVASKRKLVILSTGMASADEILAAIRIAHEGVADRIYLPENRILAQPAALILLKCTSAYPAPVSESNLMTLGSMEWGFPRYYPVGLSDHTLSIAVPVAAVALGACIIEKHLCLDRSLGGPDAAFSLEPVEFKMMAEAIRETEQALGEVRYGPTESERESLRFRRSLYVVEDVAAGDGLGAGNVRSIRAANGLDPGCLGQVLGRSATVGIRAGTPLGWEMIG